MSNVTVLQPENFEIANVFLQFGTAKDTAEELQVPLHKVTQALQTPEVKRYLDSVYLDLGYRNRDKLGALLDRIIESKIADAEDSGVWSSKDLLEVITLAHKMRMDEIRAQKEVTGPSTVVQVANSFGEGAYGKLMEKLLG